MKHSGKTSIGQKLSALLERPFYDMDELIEKHYDPSQRVTCRHIYQQEGAHFFRSLEADTAHRFSLRMDSMEPIVLALGGGTLENQAARPWITGKGLMIYLAEEPDVLFERIASRGLPPFLSKEQPYQSFLTLYEKRRTLFQQVADATLQLQGRSIDEAAAVVKALLKELEDAGE
jgi:shikimate kinase